MPRKWMLIGSAADAQMDPSNGAPIKPSLLRTVFIGVDGLRAGWSLLIFFALMAAISSGMSAVLRYTAYQPPPQDAPWSVGRIFLTQVPAIFMTGLATWIMSKIEKRPIRVYGLGSRSALPNFLFGLASGPLVSRSSSLLFGKNASLRSTAGCCPALRF